MKNSTFSFLLQQTGHKHFFINIYQASNNGNNWCQSFGHKNSTTKIISAFKNKRGRISIKTFQGKKKPMFQFFTFLKSVHGISTMCKDVLIQSQKEKSFFFLKNIIKAK